MGPIDVEVCSANEDVCPVDVDWDVIGSVNVDVGSVSLDRVDEDVGPVDVVDVEKTLVYVTACLKTWNPKNLKGPNPTNSTHCHRVIYIEAYLNVEYDVNCAKLIFFSQWKLFKGLLFSDIMKMGQKWRH